MNHTQELTKQLFDALDMPDPVATVVWTAAQYFDCPMYLVDVTGKIILSGLDPKHPLDIEKTTVDPRHGSIEDAQKFYAIRTGKHLHLYLMPYVEDEARKELDPDDMNLIIKTLELLCQNAQFIQCESAAQLMFYDLLCSSAPKENLLKQRCLISGLSYDGPYGLMAICNAQNITDLPVFNIARKQLERLVPNALFIIHHNRLVMLYDYEKHKAFGEHHEDLLKILKSCQLTAAISLPFASAKGIYEAYTQTLQALDEGLSLDSNENLYVYQDYLPYHALLEVDHMEDFCHPCIQELLDYDALHQTDYIHTFYVYIMNFQNMKDTARQLNIHYNTLKYRLKKIDELLDFPVDDSSRLLLLYLSFIYMKLKGYIF